MIFSRNWLAEYFEKGLPEGERIAEAINLHAFEIDGVEKKGDDFVLDIDILPDRSPYVASHQAMANEISAIANLEIALPEAVQVETNKKVSLPKVRVENKKDCPRYMARIVQNVKITASDKKIKERLETIGERSISNIVDATNYSLFDIGQPLHAFDAEKVKGEIVVRRAKQGEKMTTLDDKELVLDKDVLVIADDKGPIALAGIKGGKRAEIDENTKNIILESANFNPGVVRQSVRRFNLITTASKRFESGLASTYAEKGLKDVSGLISKMLPQAEFGEILDLGGQVEKPKTIEITADFIGEILGLNVPADEIQRIFSKLNLLVTMKGKKMIVNIPPERKDLNLPEDLVEEIGRIVGYEFVKPVLPKALKTRPLPKRQFSAIEKIRRILVDFGYFDSELYTFVEKGAIELASSLASDKNFLRANLSETLLKVAEMNARNAPLLGLSEIKQFEIGRVFTKEREETHLAIITLKAEGKAKSDYGMNEITNLLQELEKVLTSNLKIKVLSGKGFYLVEANITDAIDRFLAPFSYAEIGLEKSTNKKFKDISIYPFALRDIAVFVPADTSEDMVSSLIKENGGEWLRQIYLFDVFEKEISGKKRKSLAFHLIFQSSEKTLNDGEVNGFMEKITKVLNGQKGFEVR